MAPAGKKLTKIIQKLAAKAKAKTVPKSNSSSRTNHRPPPVHYPSDSSLSSISSDMSTSSDNWSLVRSSDSSNGPSDSSKYNTSGTPVSPPSPVPVLVPCPPHPHTAIRNPASTVRSVRRRRNTNSSPNSGPKVCQHAAGPIPGPSGHPSLIPSPIASPRRLAKKDQMIT